MNFVIPMAGAGSRFQKVGYTLPKFLIEVRGKTLLQYSLESLPLDIADNIIFIALQEHIKQYDLHNIISNFIEKDFTLIGIKELTRGQAETVMVAEKFIDNDKDLIIYNIDTYFHSNSLRERLLDKEFKKDGVLGAFVSEENKWSFAKENKEKIVTETAEKIPISSNALTGLYHFTKGSDFVQVAKEHIEKNITHKNEFYIAPMYNDLIKKNKKFVLDFVDDFIPLGTPEDIEKLIK